MFWRALSLSLGGDEAGRTSGEDGVKLTEFSGYTVVVVSSQGLKCLVWCVEICGKEF